ARLQLAQFRLEACGRRLPGAGQVESARSLECAAAGFHVEHAGEAVGAYAVLARRARHEIPRAGLEHEAQRLEFSSRRAAPAFIVDAQATPMPHRFGHLSQESRRVLRAVTVLRIVVKDFAVMSGLHAPD